MRYNDYFNEIMNRYPKNNVDKMVKIGCLNRVELIKKVAEWLFIDGDVDSSLANETRKQLINLVERGVLCFDA